MYRNFFKRIFDFTLALIGFIIVLPILILLTIFLFMANNGKPFFRQKRPGLNEKIFTVIKFKTMTDRRDKDGNLLPDKDRLTAVGKFVRNYSLDELPQLINVIKGDMSLVGPRPLFAHYLELYNDFQRRRHEVRPGITGWAQVNGRNAISWKQKFELDVWYVDHLSFLLDLKILWLTVVKVFKKEGVAQEGQATVEFFKGNN